MQGAFLEILTLKHKNKSNYNNILYNYKFVCEKFIISNLVCKTFEKVKDH